MMKSSRLLNLYKLRGVYYLCTVKNQDKHSSHVRGTRQSIERTNAWMDSYRSVLNRFDTTQTSWEGWNYIAFILIFLKKIRKREKSR